MGEWLFDVSAEEPVVTTTYVTCDSMPVLYVSHEWDPADKAVVWQFQSGNGDHSSQRLQLVRLDTIMALDPGLVELANMPLGYAARRVHGNAPWQIVPEA